MPEGWQSQGVSRALGAMQRDQGCSPVSHGEGVRGPGQPGQPSDPQGNVKAPGQSLALAQDKEPRELQEEPASQRQGDPGAGA